MDSLQHITSLITNIPSWLGVLDEQNEQIGLRQAELARLSGSSFDQSSTRCSTSATSLKNKGSTESLRPKVNGRLEEEDEEVIVSDENEDADVGARLKKEDNITASNRSRPTSSPKVQLGPTPRSPRLLQKRTPSSKKESQPTLLKASTHPLPTTYIPPPQLMKRRKSRTSSIHSMHSSNSRTSQTPTHPNKLNRANRTRSMIIVYYDSAVQEAFEKLVRYISAARNEMRKGKMAERMERMRMLAELEDDSESSEEEEDGTLTPKDNLKSDKESETPNTNSGLDVDRSTNNVTGSGHSNPISKSPQPLAETIEAGESDDDNDDYLETIKLQFKSTRMMGPAPTRTGFSGARLSSLTASTPGHRRASGGFVDNSRNARPAAVQTSSSPALTTGIGLSNAMNREETSVYDDLDKSLEWCQSTCEGAAHRFLRDGECYSEISGVRKRLEEVVVRAEKEVARMEECEEDKRASRGLENQTGMRKRGLGNKVRMRGGSGTAREMKNPQMRKSPTPIRTFSSPTALRSPIDLTVKETPGAIEVDEDEDEGFSDMDIDSSPKLIFRSTRDGGVVRR